jgi:hypothetical protein
VAKLSDRVLISLWAVPTPTGSVSCRRTFRTDLAFQNLMFVDTGKRWLRALWNCALRGALAAGFLVRGFLGTIYAHRI